MYCALQGPDVEYALRAIPLGGFVAFPDDDPKLVEKYPKDDPNLLKNRPVKDRALVISAGIIANCIFAFSILLAQVCHSSDKDLQSFQSLATCEMPLTWLLLNSTDMQRLVKVHQLVKSYHALVSRTACCCVCK